ncbi:hypothetical protein [Runella slithyformis]|uniref:DUF5681 domain-containing protein n=1 Tax=Runella slithyformis (strain ATCC 29530 / DSM 19594 / LMG 11500 / NCIMB 11436 / LSU 4) TaxID=761193 RepID=A0A7U3ZM26_RUNSL|nr:hypothetical protein [Runella slithyformis]AEI49720.1 hypothetical protein Runsl_3352 [Runella slithyformis DSM 19594]
MGLHKGQTNNLKGRPKGVGNKLNNDLKSRIAQIVENGFEAIESDLEALEAKDRINAYLKFLEYLVPKQRETKIDISSLSDAEVEELLNKALNKLQ